MRFLTSHTLKWNLNSRPKFDLLELYDVNDIMATVPINLKGSEDETILLTHEDDDLAHYHDHIT